MNVSTHPWVLGTALFVSLVWCTMPRSFRAADRTCARRRLAPAPVQSAQPGKSRSADRMAESESLSSARAHTTASASDTCEALLVSTLAGLPARDALAALTRNAVLPAVLGQSLVRRLDDSVPLAECLDGVRSDCNGTNDAPPAHLLRLSLVGGNFVPAALQTGAALLRQRESLHLEMLVHTAHARITARFLTALPFAVLAVGAVTSGAFRNNLTTGPTLVCIVLGAVLAVVGWSWMRRLTSAAVDPHDQGELADLSFSLLVSLQAGLTLVDACMQWRHVGPTGARIADALHAHQPLRNALVPLSTGLGPEGASMVRVLCEAVASGVPLIDTASRVHNDIQHARASHASMRVQQLTTKLSVPVVLCSLPSFVLVALMPLAVTGLSTVPT